jgi:hypothetical protein
MPWRKKTGWWVSECRSVRVHALAPLPTVLSAHGEKTGFDRGGRRGGGEPLGVRCAPVRPICRKSVRAVSAARLFQTLHANLPTAAYRRLPRPPGPHEAQRRLTRASRPWLTSRALVPPDPSASVCFARLLVCSHATAVATAAAPHSACRRANKQASERASASPCRVQAIGPTGPVGP